jgi:MFS family permease
MRGLPWTTTYLNHTKVEGCMTQHINMDGRLFAVYFVNCSVTSIFTSVIPFYPILAHAKGVSFIMIGAIISCLPVVNFLASLVLGSWLEKIGRNRALMGGILLGVRTTQGSSLLLASLSLECEP